MADEPEQPVKKPVIIIKKQRAYNDDAHYGGMWKVAYADFVTAMMAFFLLMWLINTISTDKLKGVAEYFTPVIGLKDQSGTGLDGGDNPKSDDNLISSKSGDDSQDTDNDNKNEITESEFKKLVSVMNNLEQNSEGINDSERTSDNILIEKTPEGIKIQIMDSINRAVFKPGSSEIQPYMAKFLDVVARLIKTVPNYVSIEGHTSELVDARIAGMDQWSLSVDRADAIRKFYEKKIKMRQVLKIVGRANTEPFDTKDPRNPKNSRIVITLLNPSVVGKYQTAAPLQP